MSTVVYPEKINLKFGCCRDPGHSIKCRDPSPGIQVAARAGPIELSLCPSQYLGS